MTMTIDAITTMSRAVAADCDSRLYVVGVVSTDGESGRVELLLTLDGCHAEPCVIMINVTRLGQAAFERDLREKLRDALTSHLDPVTRA